MIVRTQSVLLNRVNKTFEAMGELIHASGGLNIEPVSRRKLPQPCVARIPKANSRSKVLRSSRRHGHRRRRSRMPLSDSRDLELQLRDQTAGFLLPRFAYDVPNSGKRPTLSAEKYDKRRSVAEFTAPALQGRRMTYWDPLWSLSEEEQEFVRMHFRTQSETVHA